MDVTFARRLSVNIRFHASCRDSPFKPREAIAGKDARTLRTSCSQCRTRSSPRFRDRRKRAKLGGLKRNAAGFGKSDRRDAHWITTAGNFYGDLRPPRRRGDRAIAAGPHRLRGNTRLR